MLRNLAPVNKRYRVLRIYLVIVSSGMLSEVDMLLTVVRTWRLWKRNTRRKAKKLFPLVVVVVVVFMGR